MGVTAHDNAMQTATRLRLDESAALDLLNRAHPDWPDCTGDADRCRCSWHAWKRTSTPEAMNEANQADNAEWMRQNIANTRLLIAELQRLDRPQFVIDVQLEWLNDLETELEEYEHAE